MTAFSDNEVCQTTAIIDEYRTAIVGMIISIMKFRMLNQQRKADLPNEQKHVTGIVEIYCAHSAPDLAEDGFSQCQKPPGTA